MPRNGSGTFSRNTGFNSGGSAWVDEKADGYAILASHHDTHDQDIADAITASIAKDGQTTPTANLPMGNFRHTGVGNASARTHYAAAGQIQDGSLIYGGTTAGAANAYTATLSPAITSYTTGMMVAVKIHADNTTTSTLNLNSLGAKNIYIANGTVTLLGGELQTNGTYVFIYNAALNAAAGGWYLVNASYQDWLSWTPVVTGSGSMTISSTTVQKAKYRRTGKKIEILMRVAFTTAGVANTTVTFTLPVNAAYASGSDEIAICSHVNEATSAWPNGFAYISAAGTISVIKTDAANWGLGAGRIVILNGSYETS